MKTKHSKEFMQQVCEFYSNHTWRDTAIEFGMPEVNSSQVLISAWYRKLGFLPKSAARNPNPDRAVQPKVTRKKLNFIVKSGGYVVNGKFVGKTEFAKMQRTMKVGDTFTKVTVTKHKVGVIEIE